MKTLIGIILVLFLVSFAQAVDLDYQEPFLQERLNAMRIEMQLIQTRFRELQRTIPMAEQEFNAYTAEKKRIAEEKKKEVDAKKDPKKTKPKSK